MKYIADFHVHSHFSRATSQLLIPEYLHYWAKLKGITVLGTGDFTHPGWLKELREKLEPAEEGLFKLKKDYQLKDLETPFFPNKTVRFILTAEISNIYKKSDRVRKVHNVVFAPDFETVEKIQQKLSAINANITSDGRPILGLDSRDLLEMVLDANENCFFVPAHIWTPWFSILGSKSGFDSVAEAYDDLADHIYAVETGLSTDPPMNWMCSFLDKYTLIANSDAHSPERLGRNANCFSTELSYHDIIHALKFGDPEHFLGTIDLFPQEGKYHYDGHRKCNTCWNPVETLKHNGLCSQCGKPVTVGVMNRVVQLSDRENLEQRPLRHSFQSIIPLKEILGELEKVGPNSKTVHHHYMNLIRKGVSELEFLLDLPLEEVNTIGGPGLEEALLRMRNRQIYIQEGYDGQYGIIKVFAENECPESKINNYLFKDLKKEKNQIPSPRKMINFDLEEFRRLSKIKAIESLEKKESKKNPPQKSTTGLNVEQQMAVEHFSGPALVIAGPGTGKTKVLTSRIKHLIIEKEVNPENILAVTFTNKAAAEIKQRLQVLLKNFSINSEPYIFTFHALGYHLLKEYKIKHPQIPEYSEFSNKKPYEKSGYNSTDSSKNRKTLFSIIDPEDKIRIIKKLSGINKKTAGNYSNAIEQAKQQLKEQQDIEKEIPELAKVFSDYQDYLSKQNAYDLEDLLYQTVKLLTKQPEFLAAIRKTFRWILIDEYQDINFAQYQLIRVMMPDAASNLCVIGDPDQAIYGFRGADIKFIKSFRRDYPHAKVYHLKKSYRCTDSILKASENVLMRKFSDERLLSGWEEGIKIKIVKNNTHKSEAEFVARTIEQMMGGLRFFSIDSNITEGHKETEIESLSDFVVLCRVKSQMETLEKAFKDHSIPFQTVGEEPFYKIPPICSIIDLLKFYYNPKDSIVLDKIQEDKIITPVQLSTLQNSIDEHLSIQDAIDFIIDNFFIHLKKEKENEIKKLINITENFPNDTDQLLQFLSLGTGADTYQPNLEQVTLMTLHAAKGLEFKAVFIVGCEDGLLPYSLYKNQTSDSLEEQRLLYVGMTRAQKYLFLSHAEKRFLSGREYHLKRSPFLNRIERQLIEQSQSKHNKKEIKEPFQPKLFDI